MPMPNANVRSRINVRRSFAVRCAGATIAIIALACVSKMASAESADPQSSIRVLYNREDKAVDRGDVDGMFAVIASDAVFVDERGRTHTRDEQRAGARKLFRKPTGERVFVRRALTSVQSVAADGGHATVHGVTDVETYMVNTMGTSVDGHDVVTFVDDWNRTPAGWKLTHGHAISTQTSYRAAPSAEAVEALRQMRATSQQMRDFNNANNYSACMTAQGNHKYDYQERQMYCRNQ